MMEMNTRLAEQSSGTTELKWTLACFQGGNSVPVWSQQLLVTSQARTERLNLSIPPSCGAQLWRLSGTNSGNQTGAGINLSGLNLARP